ncbi:hypothetical protein SCB49_11764 [unidentified eubacterium SCB49]|nr:hypothetical protein SCB49_11764 [unidentified eubacterium SCB49]
MKKITVVVFSIFAFVACKENTKEHVSEESMVVNDVVETDQKVIPQNVSEVLNAHGGLAQWNKMNNLCFSFDGRGGEEVHTVDLKNRFEKIENEKWSIGNDGNGVWLLQNEPEAYKGNALFYNNLMFYFYSMPFVFADSGIVYTSMPQKELDGKMYNVFKVSYEDGIGYSSKDEYMLFSDPDTNKMAWLGYTVTGKSNAKSDKWSFIKYSEWQEVNGLQLPKKLTWFKVEDNLPTEMRNDVNFNKVTVTETVIPTSVFAKPEGAVLITE